MFSMQSPMTVRLRNPRKSIFSRPMASQEGYGQPVISAPSAGRFHMGMQSSSGTLAIITAQACTPACLTTPSKPRAVS